MIYFFIGAIMIYSIIHFLFIQNKFAWKKRTQYQKVVTVVAIVTILILLLNAMYA